MNAVGIDVSKGMSTVTIRRPGDEVVMASRDIPHTQSSISELIGIIKNLNGETKVCMEHTGVIALIPATPDSPIKYPAMMLSLSSIRYITALVNVPDISMELNFFSQNPFISVPPYSSSGVSIRLTLPEIAVRVDHFFELL